MSPLLQKLSRYLGLAPALLLIYGMYFSGAHKNDFYNTFGYLGAVFEPSLLNTLPTQLALRRTELVEVSAFLQMNEVCESGAKRVEFQTCDWWEVVRESSTVGEGTIVWRSEESKRRAHEMYRRFEELWKEVEGNPNASSAQKAEWRKEIHELIEERDAYLKLVALGVTASENYFQKYLIAYHGVAVALVLVLILMRKWIGQAIILPIIFSLRTIKKLLSFLHRKV